ncbi:MAG: NADP-dependent oxidoreductase [Leptothrix sp. (in: b-proteobacteria)]
MSAPASPPLTDLNRQIRLAARPQGDVSAACFSRVDVPIAALGDGDVRVRHHFLSLDPYMRGRMLDRKSYAAPQPLGEVMIGGTVGVIEASRHPDWAAGDAVVGMGGWQTHAVVDARVPGALRRIDTRRLPMSAYLGVVGMPGVTAWYGLNHVIAPKPGQTVVVSAASGAVGSVVGQLAKRLGCRVVGVAGGPIKCAYLIDELGFDAAIDHHAHADLASMAAALKAAAPGGVDGHFENVGSVILDAVLQHANPFARIAVCGMMAGYGGAPIPITQPSLILLNRLRIEGFIVTEHLDLWPQALGELEALVAAGALTYRESVADGLDAAPQAFINLLRGGNFGKQLVKLV